MCCKQKFNCCFICLLVFSQAYSLNVTKHEFVCLACLYDISLTVRLQAFVYIDLILFGKKTCHYYFLLGQMRNLLCM